ncbi:tetraacyldisaccharide 4'-kinase [Ramlibacter sp. AW1]|uniref:Tetraacyldisaccharide 4'-kinase n=1 Tax=Ramlibacter aurantiacus TaxID=2801330 RepID=A0A937D349_9BURK|nr:tetraacyldisaccharide 4'-kinase [Ramlibacter aurantiacus]
MDASGALQRAWGRRGPLAQLLRPVSWLFGGVVQVRRQLYRRGLLHATRMRVPLVVVGNVLAGGAGKTPVVMAVVEHLAAAGVPCGVISRGYGRRTHDCREVLPQAAADEVGDEPLLISRRCGVPVFVGTSRVEAARALLRQHPQVRVLVSDDGLQHLALARDLEICVFDRRGIGNGLLLPAGPLRERWPRPADLVLRPPGVAIPGFSVDRRLAAHAVRADGERRSLDALADGELVAVAGIARPETFFDMLREAGVHPARTIALPDHAPIDAGTLDLPTQARIVCTEKDAVKLWRHHPQAWAVPLELQVEPAFWSAFDRLLGPRLSSNDGLQTP